MATQITKQVRDARRGQRQALQKKGTTMHRKRFIQAALSVATVSVTLLAQQSPAAAAPVRPLTSLPYQIQGPPTLFGGSARCINDPDGSVTNGTQMIIYNCNSPKVNNEWEFNVVDSMLFEGRRLNVYNLASKNVPSPQKCLTVQGASTANNAPIIQYECNMGPNEEWFVEYKETLATPSGNADFYWIENRNSFKCIVVQGAGTTDGAKLVQYDCNLGPNELWTWYPV